MSYQRPNVIHIYGYNPRVDLHRALSRLDELKNGYRIINPTITSTRLFEASWTHDALSSFKLPANWQNEPLYLVVPASIHIPELSWQRIRQEFVSEHSSVVAELVVALGVTEHYRVSEIVYYNRYTTFL